MASRRASALGALGYLLVVGGIIAVVLRERNAFRRALATVSQADVVPLIAAFLLVAIGYGLLAVIAWTRASDRIAGVRGTAAAAAWLGASVTKYVPGLVWHPFSAVERLQRGGATVPAATLVLLVDVAAWITSALIVGAAALPVLLQTERGAPAWLLLGLPAVALLHPRLFAAGLRLVARLTRRSMPAVELDWLFVGRIVGLHAVGWVVMGFGLSLLLAALRVDASVGATIASAALSWVAGYLFVVAPAGLGVREATLVALLAISIPLEVALGAAIIWRVMFVAVDVLSSAASLLIVTRRDAPTTPLQS